MHPTIPMLNSIYQQFLQIFNLKKTFGIIFLHFLTFTITFNNNNDVCEMILIQTGVSAAMSNATYAQPDIFWWPASRYIIMDQY